MKTIKFLAELLFLVVAVFVPSCGFFFQLLTVGFEAMGMPTWLLLIAVPVAASPFLIIVLMLQDLRRKPHGKS